MRSLYKSISQSGTKDIQGEMNNKHLALALVLAIWLIPLPARAITFDEMLGHHSSKSQPFMGEHKNIKWISHEPFLPKEMESDVISPTEADYRGQVDIGKIDLDGDGKEETLKIIWGHGVSDHSLTIEVYKGDKLISTLKGEYGIQSNYRIADIDKDGKQEIIIWSGLWDFRL